jgi:hypothetical protein
MKRVLEKIAKAFEEKDNNYSLFLVTRVYKIKDKKVRPVDTNNRTGKGPNRYPDWFKRSKARKYL